MRTNQLNLSEALNLVFAGHRAEFISDVAESIQYEGGELTITKAANLMHQRKSTRLIDGRDFLMLKDEKFNVGDDNSIQGYY